MIVKSRIECTVYRDLPGTDVESIMVIVGIRGVNSNFIIQRKVKELFVEFWF